MSISVITVNLNNKTGLEKTINSVLNQEFQDFEFLVIDGGSSDGSIDLLEKFTQYITYWISEADNGIYHAMNKGIRKANGKYLLFLNSGDALFEPKTLSTVSTYFVSDKDIYYGNIRYGEETRKFPSLLTFSYFFEHNISHQASFLRRSLFDQFFVYSEKYKIVSDWEFFIYAICRMNVSYEFINTTISCYDPTGLSSDIKNHPLMHSERLAVLNEHFPSFISDYQLLLQYQTKRFSQILQIKKYPLLWKLLKGYISVLLLFTRKRI